MDGELFDFLWKKRKILREWKENRNFEKKSVDNGREPEYNLYEYCRLVLQDRDRGAASISNRTTGTAFPPVKGLAAEESPESQTCVLWAGGENPSDCHRNVERYSMETKP